jgi:GTPase
MKTIIIDIAPPWLSQEELDHRMSELENLVSTYWGVTIVRRVQKKHTPDYRTFVGSGKLDELIAIWDELGAELLIIGNIMKPAQVWNVNEHIRLAKSKMKAWDRVDLILKIFSLHAVSPESKLQIELAAIKHMWPRIFGMGMELSRQGGGSRNAKGQGETNTEIMKRHLREKEREIHRKLKTYERTRALHRENRKRNNFLTIGIVWYTNAGKSSLFNALTKKWVLAEDKLFATLGTSVGKVFLSSFVKELSTTKKETEDFSGKNLLPFGRPLYKEGREILLNDTIWFIRDLPPDLIAAFRSTLEDSIETDLILHVVDASDPWITEKVDIVDDTLSEIGAVQPKFYVFNKIDLCNNEELSILKNRFSWLDPIYLSAYQWVWLDNLKKLLREKFF